MGRSFGGRGFGGGGLGRGRYIKIGGPLAIIIIIIFSIYNYSLTLPPSVRESTFQRKAISPNLAVGEVGYSTYDGESDDSLIKKMQYFYNETGVIPYIYFVKAGLTTNDLTDNLYDYYESTPIPTESEFTSTDDSDDSDDSDDQYYHIISMPKEREANELAENLYNSMFEDEGHMLILYVKLQGYQSDPEEQVWYYCGEDATTVIDTQAGEIFLDYVELYRYNYYEINNQVFANAFESTAKKIMGPPSYKWVAWTIGIIFVLIIIFFIFKKIKTRTNRKA